MKIIYLLFFLLANICSFGQQQYASTVLSFSSQYSALSYAAAKAIGAPDVPGCSDNSNAWASLTADGQREFLELGFTIPQPVNTIKIHQTYSTGAIDTVYLRNAGTGNWVQVYTATAVAGPCPNILTIAITTTAYNADAIRIAVNSPAVGTWNEIDAVSIENRIIIPSTSLLINGSAENGPPATGGWIAVSQGADCSGSTGWRIAGNQGGYPIAKDGDQIFFTGCYTNNIEVYELFQDINLNAFAADIDAGIKRFTFSGYVRSYDQQPRDSTQVIVEYRNASAVVLATYNTGLNGNVADWDLKTDTRTAPPGTRVVRVRLIAHRFNASSVDAYFDDLSFTPEPLSIVSLCPPAANTTITSNITGAVFQWQLNTGNGFANIDNNINYNGVNTATLGINNAPGSWYGYQYRCVVDGNNSNTYALKFTATWTGAANDQLWENAANWGCATVPDGYTDVFINSGTVTVNSNASCRSLSAKTAVNLSVKTGYNLIITH